MPTYSYQCSHCGHAFEEFQKFSDAPIIECPNCHQETVRRVIHPAGIIFKGSGWYVTDSRSRNSTTAAPKNGDGDSKAETTPAKTESKPESVGAKGGGGDK